MREVNTWDNNPRVMWVWDDDPLKKIKRFVIYMDPCRHHFPVVTFPYGSDIVHYKHCADIEGESLMTNKEIARWLTAKPGREFKEGSDGNIFPYRAYKDDDANEIVPNNIFVREGDGNWISPMEDLLESD